MRRLFAALNVGVATCLTCLPSLAQSTPSPTLSDQTTLAMSGTGEVTRTLGARFSETIDVRDFGAVGDGSTDDTAAFNAAFSMARSKLASGSVEVLIPPGRYMLSSAWKPAVSAANPLAVVGAGPDQTALVFAQSDGFDVTATGGQTVVFSGLKILTGYTGATYASTGISIVAPSANATARAMVSNVQMGDASGSRIRGWSTGLSLIHLVNSVIDNVRVQMPNWASGNTAGTGVSLGGYSGGSWAIDNQFTHLFAQGGQYGLLVNGYAQGVYVTQSVMVANAYGLYWNGAQSGDAAELLTLTNSAFNSHLSGVYLSNGSLSEIMGSQFFIFAPNTTDTANMIDLEGGNDFAVGSNVLTGNGSGTENGIVLDNVGQTPNSVMGNVISNVSGKGIWFEGTTRMAIASGNSINGSAITTAVQDDSGGYNTLGPVAYNGNPSPLTFDGVNANVNTALLFPKSGQASSVIATDGAGGLQVTNTAGNGNLLVQNLLRSLGALTAGGNLTVGGTANVTGSVVSGSNVTAGSMSSFITTDTTGPAGYIGSDGKGGLTIGTLRSGGAASLTAAGNLIAKSNVQSGANVYTGTGGAYISTDSSGSAGYLSPDNAGGLTLGTLRSGGTAAFTVGAGISAGGTITAKGNLVSGANVSTGSGGAFISVDSSGNAGYLSPDSAGGLVLGTLRSGGSASLKVTNNLTTGGNVTATGSLVSGGNVYGGANGALITTDANGSAGYLSPDGTGGLVLGTLRSGGTAALTVGGPIKLAAYTVATLPSGCTPGQSAYASDARKTGEAAGAGSGSPVICTLATKGGSAAWRSMLTGAQAVS